MKTLITLSIITACASILAAVFTQNMMIGISGILASACVGSVSVFFKSSHRA